MSTDSPATATQSPTTQVNAPYGQIILFGDSITENAFETNASFSYAAALSHAYIRRLDIINRGFSGYNTDHAMMVLPKFMPVPGQAKIELMIICFGANDSCLSHDPTGHHVPLSNFRDNLVSLITNEYQQTVADRARGFEPVRRTAENTKLYAKACREVGVQLGVHVVDIWKALLKRVGWVEGQEHLPGSRKSPVSPALQSLLSDGLHLTPAGYRVVFEEVMDSISAHYPDIDPRWMPYRCPPWESAPKPGRRKTEHAV